MNKWRGRGGKEEELIMEQNYSFLSFSFIINSICRLIIYVLAAASLEGEGEGELPSALAFLHLIRAS